MKVQVNQPETTNSQAPLNPDDAAYLQFMPTPDMFSNLLSNITPGATAGAGLDKDDEKITSDQELAETATDSDASLLNQLDTVVQAISQPVSPQPWPIPGENSASPDAAASKRLTNVAKPSVPVAALNMNNVNNVEVNEQIQENSVNNIPQVIQKNDPAKKLSELGWDYEPETPLAPNLAQPSGENKIPEPAAMKSPISDLKPGTDDKSNILMNTPAPTLSGININSVTSDQLLPKKSDVTEKIAVALNHMADFINGQINQQLEKQPDLVQNRPSPTIDYAETLNQIRQTIQEPRIEIMPNVDAAIKDSYHANIKIYPPELGRVMAKIRIDKNTAELTVVAENNVVKQIIEANLPQLRENFQQANITLTSIQVQTETKEQQNNQQQSTNDEPTRQSKQFNGENKQNVTAKSAPRILKGMVDTYV